MTKEQKRMLCDGDPEPDIVREARAAIIFLLLVVCAVLLCALVAGATYGVYELVQYIIG